MWNEGYFTEDTYTYGYYRDISPFYQQYCLLTHGYDVRITDENTCHCELGYGQGVSVNIHAAAVPLFYGGIMSVGVAYTCQALGQKDSDPTVAAIVFSMESVFSVVGGVLILHAHMAWQAYAGCALIFAGIIIAQLTPNKKTEEIADITCRQNGNKKGSLKQPLEV